DEALEGSQDGAVQHDRVPAIVVLADVLGPQAHRQVEVQLQGTALPDATQTVLQGELDLRTVEGALARLQLIGQPGGFQGRRQRGLGTVPQLVGTDALFGTGGQLELDVIKAEVGVHRLGDRKSTRLNSSHVKISYAVFCLKK